ncbi:helix-turn-helix domain-containing protein [Vibrio parahaemolyticus]|uniref:helix-turn-helix domain-containing protein n=1 Tax=Vibrio parahaemolyticus TaxID=670 RepID=UPI00389228FE
MSIKIQSYAWDILAFKGNTKLVVLCLADFANDEGCCWPSLSTVARKSGVSVSTVKSIIKSLVEGGWLSRKSRSKIGSDGRRVADSNLYTLNVDKLKKVAREHELEHDQTKSGCSYDASTYDQPNFDRSKHDGSKEGDSNSQNLNFDQPKSGYDPSVIDPLIDPSSKDLAPSNKLEPEVIPEFLIPTNRKGEFYEVYPSEIQENESLYPAVDVRQQYRNMVGWSNSTPHKRKTRKGMPKFINSWLSREQDRGGSKVPQSGSKLPKQTPHDTAESVQREIGLIESKMDSINQQLVNLKQSGGQYHDAAIASFERELIKLDTERSSKLAQLKELAA